MRRHPHVGGADHVFRLREKEVSEDTRSAVRDHSSNSAGYVLCICIHIYVYMYVYVCMDAADSEASLWPIWRSLLLSRSCRRSGPSD